MVTTITTTTTTAVTAATSASLVLIAIVTLLLLLINKQIASGLPGTRARRLSKALNVAIVPLSVVFVTSAVLKLIDLLH
jgi:hypothetical protein